jgi:hypothetical protein
VLTFRGTDGNEQVLKTTNEHPFWSVRRGAFVDAGELEVGDEFVGVGPHGELQVLTATTYDPHPEGHPVYNFEVEEFHTYFVAAHGARGPPVLVHNGAECVKARPAIIGQTMERVFRYAERIKGAVVYIPRPDFKTLSPAEQWRRNKQWLQKQMRLGRVIIDIGADRARRDKSFYHHERELVRRYDNCVHRRVRY